MLWMIQRDFKYYSKYFIACVIFAAPGLIQFQANHKKSLTKPYPGFTHLRLQINGLCDTGVLQKNIFFTVASGTIRNQKLCF
jgi:hypothetical protein